MKQSKTKAVQNVSKNGRIIPLGDRVLIKELDAKDIERKTASGIIIPETVSDDKGAKQGTVVAVGAGRYDDGELIPMTVKVGDKVIYQWGDLIKIDGEEYSVVSESNILGIIK